MELWTAWTDHYMRGEGRTLKALIAYAESADDIEYQFIEAFGDKHACSTNVGVLRNEVTSYLFSDRHLDLIQSEAGNAEMKTSASFFITFI